MVGVDEILVHNQQNSEDEKLYKFFCFSWLYIKDLEEVGGFNQHLIGHKLTVDCLAILDESIKIVSTGLLLFFFIKAPALKGDKYKLIANEFRENFHNKFQKLFEVFILLEITKKLLHPAEIS